VLVGIRHFAPETRIFSTVSVDLSIFSLADNAGVSSMCDLGLGFFLGLLVSMYWIAWWAVDCG